MKQTVLLFDIGNTAVKVGLACGGRVVSTYSLSVAPGQSSDTFGLTLLSLLGHAGTSPKDIGVCLASSVVPDFNPVLREACRRFAGCETYFAPDDIAVPLGNNYERPHEVGADRLVGAYAARRAFPSAPSIIVVDYGTAVTFDCIDGDTYMGGLIFPGPQTATAALAGHTARLPRVSLDIDAGEPAIGRNTAVSIRHGIFFGFAGMTESLISRLAAQLPGKTTVVATGGFAEALGRAVGCFDHVMPGLVLDGLCRLHAEAFSNENI